MEILTYLIKAIAVVVSVPSFGDSFFIIKGNLIKVPYQGGFRPLIRGFFFYKKIDAMISPLMACFRPLIRGFFFYQSCVYYFGIVTVTVSVPSFGDSFFIRGGETIMRTFLTEFPSPHSGILFLSCRYDMPPSLNIFAIFRRILHLLAQKGFPLTQSIHFSPYPSASARIKSFFIHIVPSPIPLNQYIITSSSFISPMPHDLTLVWS